MPAKAAMPQPETVTRQELDAALAQQAEWRDRHQALKKQMEEQQARVNAADQDAAALHTRLDNMTRAQTRSMEEARELRNTLTKTDAMLDDARQQIVNLRDLLTQVVTSEVVGPEYVTIHLPKNVWDAIR